MALNGLRYVFSHLPVAPRVSNGSLSTLQTTSRQVSLARDHIILRSHFSLWLAARRRHADLATRVEYVDDVRRLRSAFRTWQRSIGEKKRRELRAGVKRRLSLIQSSIDVRIKKEAWKVCNSVDNGFYFLLSNHFLLYLDMGPSASIRHRNIPSRNQSQT